MSASRHLAKCEKRERDRERKHRKAKKRSHLANAVSLERLQDQFDKAEKMAAFTDNGAGAEAVIRCAERDLRKAIIEQARERVKKHARGLLQVFDLVIKNGHNRKESIWQIVKSRKRLNGKPRKSTIGGA